MVKNTGWISFKCFYDKYGHLVPVEGEQDIPFQIKRVYYIYSVDDGVRRGFHSHNKLEQALICIHGSVKILVKNPYESENILLDDPTKALYIGPMVWREMYDFSSDAVLLVLASGHYDVGDYVRDYSKYEKAALNYFKRGENEGNEHTVCNF
ncbi:MAG: WxcM-like domain-containing protein [Lachnospiraceae bacterium]|nr:WxcM-like domain-containing protein [Lachnospiraceae bacterium]